MSEPKRIQRRRAKGWRLPENAIVVDRTTPWGNPFIVGKDGSAAECVTLYRRLLGGYLCLSGTASLKAQANAREHAVRHIDGLRGRELACWCRPGNPCHADVLLELANAPTSPSSAPTPHTSRSSDRTDHTTQTAGSAGAGSPRTDRPADPPSARTSGSAS